VLLPVNLNVRDRLCVLVGGGKVARRKCGTLVEHGARVRVISPRLEAGGMWDSPAVDWIQDYYEPGMLEGAFLVIAATNDGGVNRRVAEDARNLPALVLRADSAEDSDITFPATLRRGSLSVSFATDGADPALAAALKHSAERLSASVVDKPAGQGFVWLAGAGPGDPGLLTVKAAVCLAAADVVIHDGLVDPAVLDLYCHRAERIDVGKRKGRCRHLQPEINAMMIELARAGRRVVRLKGGDPMVFGRGGEEMRALAAAGIAHEVVPGVSTIAAVPACAGIPVTDREHGAASLGVYSLHRRNGMPLSEGEWRRMAQGPDTLVLLMGKTLLGQVAGKLVQYGRAPSTPIALIADGTTPQQRRVLGTLADIESRVDVGRIAGPALIVVGEVVRAAMPLAGRRPAAVEARPGEEPSDVTEVLLIRHGETGDEYRGRYVGRMDPPLSTIGVEHAAALRRHAGLAHAGAACLASPSLRARQTAAAAGFQADIDEDLREIDFGHWEGLRFSEIAAADPDGVERWARLDAGFRFPGGESLAEFETRVRRLAERLAAGPPRKVVAVTHGGVIRALVCHWLGLPAETHLLLEVGPASVTRLRLSGNRGTLCALNDLCHTAEVIR
jgi:uroporphyrin-III C-methyltransferase/precorrin-2 dehydrogenase/sirohydrochlorin ferrochelatase